MDTGPAMTSGGVATGAMTSTETVILGVGPDFGGRTCVRVPCVPSRRDLPPVTSRTPSYIHLTVTAGSTDGGGTST